MIITLSLGNKEKTEVLIQRNWFNGNFTYSVDGDEKELRSPLNPTTHFSPKQKNSYQFSVGLAETHKVLVEHTRAVMLGGILPQKFEFFVNGKLHTTYKGY